MRGVELVDDGDMVDPRKDAPGWFGRSSRNARPLALDWLGLLRAAFGDIAYGLGPVDVLGESGELGR